MFQSYIRIAWRNFRRNKGYSFINIAGLAAGMAIALLITLFTVSFQSLKAAFMNPVKSLRAE